MVQEFRVEVAVRKGEQDGVRQIEDLQFCLGHCGRMFGAGLFDFLHKRCGLLVIGGLDGIGELIHLRQEFPAAVWPGHQAGQAAIGSGFSIFAGQKLVIRHLRGFMVRFVQLVQRMVFAA